MINKYFNKNKRIINLIDISKVKLYKDIFSSFQWVHAFQRTYNPVHISPVSCKHVSTCYFLDKNNIMKTIGDPFNDFNPICTCPEFLSSIKKIHKNILISNSEILLTENKVSETECYKTVLENYEKKISNRIYKQYINTQKEVKYQQIPANDPDFMNKLLWLLKNRQNHLIKNRPTELNDSYHNNFNDLIIEFCLKSNHCSVVRLDVLELVNSNEIVAINLNFYATDGVMCYLRACARNKSNIKSYGLILDLYIMKKAKEENYQVYDLTRGGEAYKLRLGAEKYILYNQLIKD